MTDDDVARTLAEFIMSKVPSARDAEVTNLRRVSQGLSRENWVFDATWVEAGGRVDFPLIVRRDPVASLLDTDRQMEFLVLEALAASSIPAPIPLWLDPDGSWLGRPALVMVRAEGDCDWFILNGSLPLGERLSVGHQMVDLLADVHSFGWQLSPLVGVLADPGADASTSEVLRWTDKLLRSQLEPHPELAIVRSWLLARAPRAQKTVLTHGDLKPGNVLFRGSEISVLLDWELAHLGDPLEDLGWITNPYRRREHQIRGAWETEHIVRRYVARTGNDVDESELRWWNVFSCYKLAVIILTGVRTFVDGPSDRTYHVPMDLYRLMFRLIGASRADR